MTTRKERLRRLEEAAERRHPREEVNVIAVIRARLGMDPQHGLDAEFLAYMERVDSGQESAAETAALDAPGDPLPDGLTPRGYLVALANVLRRI